MDCSCEVHDSIDDGPSFSFGKTLTARKEHRCCECKRTIRPGEKYQRDGGLWDGVFTVYKTCYDCLTVRNTFFKGGWVYEMIWSDLMEYISGCDGDLPPSCITTLPPASRDQVCDMVQKYWSDNEE